MSLAISATAIDGFATDLTITRTAAGSYVNGIWTPGEPGLIPIRGVPLAINAAELRDLPEGIRSDAEVTLYSRTEIALDDALTWRGFTYRVIHVWPRVEGSYFKAVLGKRQAAR